MYQAKSIYIRERLQALEKQDAAKAVVSVLKEYRHSLTSDEMPYFGERTNAERTHLQEDLKQNVANLRCLSARKFKPTLQS